MLDDYKVIIGQRIKELRKTRKMQIDFICDKLDVAVSTYTGWEMGRRSPNGGKLVELADLFNTSVDYITGKTDTHHPIGELESILNAEKLTLDGKDISKEQEETIKKLLKALLAE